MTTTPPTPFSEGGKPQSKINPGNPQRELIHEVRNLSQAVAILNNTYLKKEDFERKSKIAYLIAGIVVTIVAALIASVFILQGSYHHQENVLVAKLISGCQSRNEQSLATSQFIHGLLALNTQSARLQPQTPFVKKLEHEYITLLKNYQHSQPAQVKCSELQ